MKDTLFTSALEALKTNGLFPITSKLEDGLLFFKDRCFIPANEDLRWNITTRYHDSLTGGHPRHLKTLELICQNYWWLGMTIFIKNYIADCAICQKMKVNMHSSAPSLFPIKAQTNTLLFSQVTCDFITGLPECNGFDSFMVMVNHGSLKELISIPCNKTIDATQTAQNYINHIYQWFGLPNSFLSDRGPQFNSRVFKEMMRLLGVKTLWSTAYHLQTDGETECVNQELEIYFQIFCTNCYRTAPQPLILSLWSYQLCLSHLIKQTIYFFPSHHCLALWTIL